MGSVATEEFAAFFDGAERRLRLALSGAFGIEAGRDAAAEALTWGWQHWARLQDMDNPVGYLYRVGRSSALRSIGHDAPLTAEVDVQPAAWEFPSFEPELSRSLAGLSEQQRVAVWMVHGLGFTHTEVAEILDCSKPTVGTHVQRGLRKLREGLGVDRD
ncbi:MAG: sigma-70 family RNA polymerase sigma factor [Actinomycetota bacterium]